MKHFSKHKDIPKYVTELSRENRKNQTPQEELLWKRLSGKKVGELKFRRQFPIGRYIVDFYNHLNKLVIEIDGKIHEQRKEYDKNRENYLKACGYKIIRFTNDEVESNIEYVIKTIIDSTKVPLRGI